jgi:hypothetical protein
MHDAHVEDVLRERIERASAECRDAKRRRGLQEITSVHDTHGFLLLWVMVADVVGNVATTLAADSLVSYARVERLAE